MRSPVNAVPGSGTAGGTGSGGRLAVADAEATFLSFIRAFGQWNGSRRTFILRNPRTCGDAIAALRRLPELTAAPSAGPEGAAIRESLLQRSSFRRSLVPAVAVLPLPDSVAEVGLGARNQTLRRKVRSAERLGLTCRTVDDPAERRRLMELAADFERVHPDARYRNQAPDNADLPECGMWLAVYAADQRPVLLSVSAVDGEWAMLRYFRTIGTGDEQSDGRYLAHLTLARRLTGTGVRYLFDREGLTWLPEGLLHYQRMVGFRPHRVRLERS
jgi:hypothetical protein